MPIRHLIIHDRIFPIWASQEPFPIISSSYVVRFLRGDGSRFKGQVGKTIVRCMVTCEQVASGIGIVVARGWKRECLGEEEEKNRDDHGESRLVLEISLVRKLMKEEGRTNGGGWENTIPSSPPIIRLFYTF